MTEIKKVGVLGCGLMGSGVAQIAAAAGYTTVVREVDDAPLAKGKAGIEKSLAKFVEKGKLTEADRDATLGRLSFVTDMEALKDCGIVIEAVTEDLEIKNTLWKELDALCPPATIFASNTSSLTIAAMAGATERPDRFVGLHFFNPVPLMKLVEVVRTITTSQETFDTTFAFATSLVRVHRQSLAGSLPAGRHSGAGNRCRLHRGHRQRHEARLLLPDGPPRAAGFRRQ